VNRFSGKHSNDELTVLPFSFYLILPQRFPEYNILNSINKIFFHPFST
jgi:hypothetical protein